MSYGQDTRATSSFSKPAEIGKEYTVDITDTGRGGDGVTKNSRFSNFCKKCKSRGQKHKD